MKILLPVFLLITGSCFAGWNIQLSGTSNDLYSVNFNHGNDDIAWACGENGTILFTSNAGVTWTLQKSGTTNDLFSIVFMETVGGPVYAVGEGGIILRTSNQGMNWSEVQSPVTKNLRDISDFNFIIVGDSGTILKSTDIGLTWSVIPSPTTKALYAVSGTFGICAVGEDGTALAGTGTGQSWSLLSTGISNNLVGLPLFGAKDLAVGNNGIILRSSNNGITWFTQNSLTTADLNSVEYSVNNTSRIYVVGDSGVILKTTNGGVNWGFQQSNTSENLNSTFFYLNDSRGYAVGDNGTILYTSDGGGTITVVTSASLIIPDKFELHQNYPNPFNASTKIGFNLPKDALVSLKVYDISGKEIAVLIKGEMKPGFHSILFNTDKLSAGIYFYRIDAGEFTQTKRMILAK